MVADNDVVISGLSGRYPESDNVEEFRQHLFNGDDMVTIDSKRWEPGQACEYDNMTVIMYGIWAPFAVLII